MALRVSLGLLAIILVGSCSKGKCEVCAVDSDCGSGLACHPKSHVCRKSGDKSISCPADCAVSQQCDEGGLCTFRNGKCVISSDNDCRRSAQCKNEGKCNRRDFGEVGECVSVNAEDCKKSANCRTLGQCSVNPRSRECQVASDNDCVLSDVCTKEKKCRANNGTCATTAPAAAP
jgi:hypothetical protein